MDSWRLALFFFMAILYINDISKANEQDSDAPNLDPRVQVEPKPCTADNGEKGVCVMYYLCNENRTIVTGGVIDDSELRQKTTCLELEWCCTLEKTLPPPYISTKNNACTVPDSDECPWCVSIHKSTSTEMSSKGLFCMGSMVGTRVVLTASSCIKASENLHMWVRVPKSADPKRNYKIRHRLVHPYYNSGSHEYDFGILVLENDVKWQTDQWKGACLGLRTPLHDECVAYGFDADNAITSTLLSVKKGSCSNQGNIPDAACGTMFHQSFCLVSIGSPVICSAGNGGALVSGVARNGCYGESVLLGSLALSADWLTKELQALNLLPKFYQINQN